MSCHVSYEEPVSGEVTGDWRPVGAAPLRCRIGGYWNGFAEPLFAEREMLIVVAEQAAILSAMRRVSSLEGVVDEPMLAPGTTVLTVVERGEAPTLLGGELTEDGGVGPMRLIKPLELDGEPHWPLGLGWTWQRVDELAEDPAEPTAAQRERYEAIAAQVGRTNLSGPLVRADGTHMFSILLDLGNATEAGITQLEAVGEVTIDRDGGARSGR